MKIKIKNWDKIFHIIYSLGASIVIIGVIGKLSRLIWGDYLLYLGLIMEAVIFFISAFQVPKNYKKKVHLDGIEKENILYKEKLPNSSYDQKNQIYSNKLNEKFYNNFKESLENTQQFNKQIKNLANKIAHLNKIYNEMLLTMNQTNFSKPKQDFPK